MSVIIIVKCISCGAKREIKAGEIAPGDHPMCACGMPMIAHIAKATEKDAARYRWLRTLPGNEEAMLALEAACYDPVTPEQFDAAIDKVMKK